MRVRACTSLVALTLLMAGGLHCAESEVDGGSNAPAEFDAGDAGDAGPNSSDAGPILPPSKVLELALDDYGTTYARLEDGRVFRWGRELSDGDPHSGIPTTLPPTVVPTVVPALFGTSSLTVSYGRACSMRSDHHALCWGHDFMRESTSQGNQLLTLESRLVPTDVGIENVIRVATTSSSSCVLTQDGRVHCWGLNNFLQVYPDTSSFDEEGVFPPRTVPNLEGAVDIGMTSGGAGWGSPISCALLVNGEVHCWGGPLKKDFTDYRVIAFPGFSGIEQMSVGGQVLVKGSNGAVYRVSSWGWTVAPELTFHELRYASTDNPAVGMQSTQDATTIVQADGRIDFMQNYPQWGIEYEGRLSPTVYASIHDAQLLAMGSMHSCYVAKSGVVSCVGQNDVGQLGDGTTISRDTFAPVIWPAEPQPAR